MVRNGVGTRCVLSSNSRRSEMSRLAPQGARPQIEGPGRGCPDSSYDMVNTWVPQGRESCVFRFTRPTIGKCSRIRRNESPPVEDSCWVGVRRHALTGAKSWAAVSRSREDEEDRSITCILLYNDGQSSATPPWSSPHFETGHSHSHTHTTFLFCSVNAS